MWTVSFLLTGFTPDTYINHTANFTELDCASGESRQGVRGFTFPTRVDSNGNLILEDYHSGVGSYDYAFVDGAGKAATLAISTYPDIAFVSDRDGNEEIYKVRLDGAQIVRLTDNPASDAGPSWSPDGTRLAFHSNRSGRNQLYVMDADGNNLAQILQDDGDDTWPIWSPNGNMIAFARSAQYENAEWRTEIYVADLQNAGIRRMTATTGSTSGMAHSCWPSGWTSDSSSLLYYCYVDGLNSMWAVNSDGTNQRRLVDYQSWNSIPTSSPDSTSPKIAFATYRDGNYEIYTADFDGSNLLRLTTDGSEDWRPNWSLEGRKIIFESKRNGNTQVFMMNPDGTNQVLLSDSIGTNTNGIMQP